MQSKTLNLVKFSLFIQRQPGTPLKEEELFKRSRPTKCWLRTTGYVEQEKNYGKWEKAAAKTRWSCYCIVQILMQMRRSKIHSFIDGDFWSTGRHGSSVVSVAWQRSIILTIESDDRSEVLQQIEMYLRTHILPRITPHLVLWPRFVRIKRPVTPISKKLSEWLHWGAICRRKSGENAL